MEEKLILKLVCGTAVTERDGCPFLVLDGREKFAQSDGQARVLRALAQGSLPLGAVTDLLQDEGLSQNEAAFALAGFILDFSDFLEG
jgi:DNA-nicking Smr family endonuclease